MRWLSALAVTVAVGLGAGAPAPAHAQTESVLVQGGRILTGTKVHQVAPSGDWSLSLTARLERGSALALRGRGWSITLRRHSDRRTTLR